MLIFSRKTNSCWVPPFYETPIWMCKFFCALFRISGEVLEAMSYWPNVTWCHGITNPFCLVTLVSISRYIWGVSKNRGTPKWMHISINGYLCWQTLRVSIMSQAQAWHNNIHNPEKSHKKTIHLDWFSAPCTSSPSFGTGTSKRMERSWEFSSISKWKLLSSQALSHPCPSRRLCKPSWKLPSLGVPTTFESDESFSF